MSEYVLFYTTNRYKTVIDQSKFEKVAEYEYYFFGKLRTTFSVCKINDHYGKVSIQSLKDEFPENRIPLRVFPKFDSLKTIEKDIYELDQDSDNKVVKTL